jgi:hypothetical protein
MPRLSLGCLATQRAAILPWAAGQPQSYAAGSAGCHMHRSTAPLQPVTLFPRDARRDALAPKVSPETVIGGSCRNSDLDAA